MHLYHQVVYRCTRCTVNLYDPKTGKYYLQDNVLVRIESEQNATHKLQRLGIQETNSKPNSQTSDGNDNADIAYCVKRKLSSSVYGSVYKGFVLKKRKCQTLIKPRAHGRLDVIREDDELLGSNQHQNCPLLSKDDSVWEPMHKNVIIKTASWDKIRRLRGKHLEDPLKEIQAMQLLEGSSLGGYHPHVIHSTTALQDDKYIYNITPYCRDGDLGGVVMGDIMSNVRMSENNAKHWIRQILLGLHHLQQKGVCHRDLSLENIVVHGKTCKIIDFGMALRVPYAHPSNVGSSTDVSDGTTRLPMLPQGQGGDFTYMSPEVLNRDSKFDGFAIDLWSVGVILYIMLIGTKPFKWPHSSDEMFVCLCVDGLLKDIISYWNIELSDDAVDLIQRMLLKDKIMRPTLAEVMEHPWLNSNDETSSVHTDTSTIHTDNSTIHTSNPSVQKEKKGSKLWSRRKQKQ